MEIVLKYKTQVFFGCGPLGAIVKKGRKIEAKIYPPNTFRKDFQIEMNGLAFYRPTLETSLEFVREQREQFSNAFSNGTQVKVTMEQN